MANESSQLSSRRFQVGDPVRVVRGTYAGVRGEYMGLRVGGDIAIEVGDPLDYDLREGETLCVGYDDAEVEGMLA